MHLLRVGTFSPIAPSIEKQSAAILVESYIGFIVSNQPMSYLIIA